MARLPRLVVPHQPHYVIQRGTDLQSIFRDASDYQAFSGWLREAAKQFKVAIHAYVLLPTHLNLLVTPSDETGLGRMMQWVGRQYVPYFNKKVGRSGTLWQGRYKATVIDAERYLMICSRYIECSPVYAGIVGNAAEYPFSSCAHHVGLKSDPLITDHPLYWALGNTPFEREAAFRQLIEQELSPEEMATVDSAARTGWALGTEKFKAALEKQTTRRVSPAKRGRPLKHLRN
ncbi:MAG: transposase [Pseudomonadota bacterium]